MKKLEKYLPVELLEIVKSTGDVNEIRIKRNSKVTLKTDNRHTILDNYIDSPCFDNILDKLLCHSYHSKEEELLAGYISLGDGYRCGVAGQAVIRSGKLTNISEIDSVCIRIPHLIRGVCEPLFNSIQKYSFRCGVLIYSPPGEGKTTLLRDLCIRLCDSPVYRRVALIDSRREVFVPLMQRYPLLDVYSGYPKDIGFENAIRSMAPDIAMCDEIGNIEETEAILANISCGVPIIATTHGSELEEIMRRKNIMKLCESGVFGIYAGIKRKRQSRKYEYVIRETRNGN